MKSKFERIVKVLKQAGRNFLKWLQQEEYLIMYSGCLFINILVSSSYTGIIGKTLIIVVLYILCYVGALFYIDEKVEENKLPELEKRLTFKDENGNIYVDKKDWPKAMIYLSEIEDYISKKHK